MELKDIPGFEALTAEEKISLAERIWQSVSPADMGGDFPEDVKRTLREREDALPPGQMRSLDSVLQSVRRRLSD